MSEQPSVLLHDFAGHPFQIQLSRALSRRGFDITHAHSSDTVTGKGTLQHLSDDEDSLDITPISPPAAFQRYSPVGRVRFELSYARELVRVIDRVRPDVVITCNTPLFVLQGLTRHFRRARQPWVLWHQDIVSLAVGQEARHKLPRPLAALVAGSAVRFERSALRSADAIVPIGTDFVRQYGRWDLLPLPITVIANWAPLDEICPAPRDNAWSREAGLSPRSFRLLYSGTLGRKHNPRLLIDLLNACQGRGVDAELVVISEGEGADLLRTSTQGGREDVHFFGYQPMDQLPLVLGSADVTVGLLEPEAATFSIPSKVLSYMAAGRPTVLLAPEHNSSVSTVRASGGMSAQPNAGGVAAAAAWIAGLAADSGLRARTARAARAFAEQNFSVDDVAAQFTDIIRAVGRKHAKAPAR